MSRIHWYLLAWKRACVGFDLAERQSIECQVVGGLSANGKLHQPTPVTSGLQTTTNYDHADRAITMFGPPFDLDRICVQGAPCVQGARIELRRSAGVYRWVALYNSVQK
jgi:hypothetical protein